LKGKEQHTKTMQSIIRILLFFALPSILLTQCLAVENDSRELASLAQKWNISGPLFDYEELGFSLNYEVSDFILDAMVEHEIYDQDCAEGGVKVDSSILTATFTPDNTAAGTGDLMRGVNVDVVINPDTISSSSIYSEQVIDNQMIATVRFCHRFMLSTLSDSPIEVNFREALVTLTIDLTDGFSIGALNVSPKDKFAKTANQVYQVEGYQCTYGNQPLSELQLALSRNQGSLIRVCVRPDETARDDGIYMRSIDSFVFERDYGGAIGKVTQVAIVNGEEADNLLTLLYCTAGDEICAFESLLMAIFFRLSGAVDGTGIASMQFGSSPPSSRQLRSREAQDDIVAAVVEFEISMELLPRNDLLYYSAGATTGFWLASGVSVFVSLLGLI
jgi:hypothetical protein